MLAGKMTDKKIPLHLGSGILKSIKEII